MNRKPLRRGTAKAFLRSATLLPRLRGLPWPWRLAAFGVSLFRGVDRRSYGAPESRFQRQNAYLILFLPQLFAIGVGAGDISEQSRLLQQLKRCRMHSYTEPFKASVN